jgi:hypothetical protein
MDFLFADEFFTVQHLDKAMAEKFGKGLDAFYRHEVEATFFIHQPASGEDMQMGMEDQVVTKGLHGGNRGELTIREIQTNPHPVAKAIDGYLEKQMQEFPPFAKNTAQGSRHGKHKLTMWYVKAYGLRDPVTCLTNATLVATGAEVAGLTTESEQFFMPAVGTLEPG